ncbi:MerR family transcriptional regulator [Paenibacillus sp. MMS20-IR301]|uniref:MerR family transcriptional regulator n=1 Tax=Paenibacillus sp. MMS20-IR301 TaxID=2895946 RepID=UPI0028EFA51B|nr:MerR family transcriptional regulator [Paenibacillus sp. MMS20-IR301]WNS44702.1 MerR family transcriptional regulator [Paenibacillus sp. MMS20-IR301]
MQIGGFVSEMGTTADTVRYYMELHLLKPALVRGRYFFAEKEVMDFRAVTQLKQWGLAMKEIQRLFGYKAESGCGTADLLAFARTVLLERLQAIDARAAELDRQRTQVLENLAEIEELITK